MWVRPYVNVCPLRIIFRRMVLNIYRIKGAKHQSNVRIKVEIFVPVDKSHLGLLSIHKSH